MTWPHPSRGLTPRQLGDPPHLITRGRPPRTCGTSGGIGSDWPEFPIAGIVLVVVFLLASRPARKGAHVILLFEGVIIALVVLLAAVIAVPRGNAGHVDELAHS